MKYIKTEFVFIADNKVIYVVYNVYSDIVAWDRFNSSGIVEDLDTGTTVKCIRVGKVVSK